MKKFWQIGILIVLGIAIVYQAYVYFEPNKADYTTLPEISLTLLNKNKTTISKIGADKHIILFIIRSNCDYCKRQMRDVRENLDRFDNTEIVFISFESLDVIEGLKNALFPGNYSQLTFAQATRGDVDPYLKEELVYPYMLWYDNNGGQKVQHRGVFPSGRIVEAINKTR